ncbi:hypothetical protein SDC9_199542 [bioreactor metagenome]|uniref:DUF3276 family protein n=1 Tax=bioreactor metagenome TaxID=1076179 RepID=A0A645IM24_9ZZZZ|nr:DUF3276 family protein [Paludibacter sp.]
MEAEKRKVDLEKKDNEIIYSKSIKAGKRIYYLDVKKSRNNDLFLAITESKKKVNGFDQDAQVTYEKHKIFLYKEDFSKFVEGLEDVIGFIKREQGEAPQREYSSQPDDEEVEKAGEEVPETKKGFFDKFKF